MNRINFIMLLACALLSNLHSIAQQASIANRWWIAGKMKGSNIVPLNSKSQEFEFLKSNTFNIYDNGVLKETGNYTVASDKKSILLKHKSNRNIPIKIVKVTATQLHMIFDIPSSKNDTVICYAKNSELAKKGKQKASILKDTKIAWEDMYIHYGHRKDLINNLAHLVKDISKSDNEVFNRTFNVIGRVESIEPNSDNLTTEHLDNFQNFQNELTKCSQDLIDYAKRYPNVTASKDYADLITQLTETEKKIEVLKSEFEKSFAAYSQL